MGKPYRVFCCYAREDQKYLQRLKTHLKPLEREELITVKADINIVPGTHWEPAIHQHLEAADIILLLISPDFLASDYCFNQEMQQAITRNEQGMASVVPILIRPTDWRNAPFSVLYCLPKNGKPVSAWKSADEAFLDIIEGIRMLIQSLPTYSDTYQEKENPSMPLRKEDPSSASKQEQYINKYNFKNSKVNTIVDGAHEVHIHEGQKDGIAALKKGSRALDKEDYSRAERELKQAIDYIDEDNQPEEASQAHYFLILALLEGKLPRSQGSSVVKRIKELMREAISLCPCESYYRIFACINRDLFESTRSPSLLKEAESFERDGALLSPREIDNDNLEYFQLCQPRLKI